jgi:conjugative relaxase-like TrwC/TraI family protein
VISLRRMSLGSGYRYLMESVATGDGAVAASSNLTRYYAESGTPPGVFMGAGLGALDEGRGVQAGSPVSQEHLFNLLGMCADPVTGQALGRQPNRSHLSLSKRVAARIKANPMAESVTERAEQVARIEAEERARTSTFRPPVAGFDLTFSPSKSVSLAWALGDQDAKERIYRCHRRAIEIVLAYAERQVFHSRSGTNGVVQEDIEGVVATAFTHFDSRAGDPQLHDHVVVANRARSVSDSVWRTLDSRGLFKSVVMLSELHQGVLSDLLTEELGWGWEGRARRHSDQLRYEVTGVAEVLMREFSQRAGAIEVRKDTLIAEFAATRGRQPTSTEVLELRRRATLETRPAKDHHSLAAVTAHWRIRAEPYLRDQPGAWVATLAERNDLPLLHAADLAEGILSDAASVAVAKVAERRATFSRANVLAEVHRQLQGVRFFSPDERITVAEHTADLALAQSLLISAPELHHAPERLRRSDGTSRLWAKGHEIYTTATVLEAETRLLEAGRKSTGPSVSAATLATTNAAPLSGRDHGLSLDQAAAIEQIATSGRSLDVLVGPAGTGKSTTMAGLRFAWEAEHGPGSVLGLAPSAAAAETLASELGVDTETTAKWLHEHRQEGERLARIAALRSTMRSLAPSARQSSTVRSELSALVREVGTWQLRAGQLVIVDEASLAGTFALDELVGAAHEARAKVLLVGDQAQLSAVEASGMFGALVRDRDGRAPELTDVRRFNHGWEKVASVELREGSETVIDAYVAHDRITDGSRDQMLAALYAAWKHDTDAGQRSLMIAGDQDSVNELNARARAELVAAGLVEAVGIRLSGGAVAGVGDLVVTRQNNRRLLSGQRWVRNGDHWSVTATRKDGSVSVRRVGGHGTVVLPADYVNEHLDLGYASTAHRAQGRTVDTAHAIVSPTTTREALYVSATRGRKSNHIYVDTHYDPDPQTAHSEVTEKVSARKVLTAVLANEGADVAAHDMIRRQHAEAEGMERLAAEYLTLATLAQAERWDALLARSGLPTADVDSIRASEAHGPLLAALRDAEACGLDVEDTFPLLVAARPLDDAQDIAAVLHGRVERWSQASRSRRQGTGNLIVGLIPRAERVSDPDLASALLERDQAMQKRACTLAEQAIEERRVWVRRLGTTPADPKGREQFVREVSVVAAYRDRWHITSSRTLGAGSNSASTEQRVQRQRALTAARQALIIGQAQKPPTQTALGLGVQIDVGKGVEL